MGFAQTPESAGRSGLAGRDGVREAAWRTGNMSATVTRSLRAFPGLTPPAGVPATANRRAAAMVAGLALPITTIPGAEYDAVIA